MRFRVEGEEKTGILCDETVEEVSGDVFHPGQKTGRIYGLEDIKLLSPISPGKIICIGFNYKAHMDELQDIATKKPTLTLKAQNTVIGSGEPILLPASSSQVEHEAELGIILKKGGYRIKEPEKHILGYTIVNDVTARDLERDMKQWSASKSFPTFCPTGPCIETELDPEDLEIKCRVNGELRQDSRTSKMIYGPAELVGFVSSFMRLEAGDLIASGTIPGVGLLRDGDRIEIEIPGIGVLWNPVELE